MSADAEPRPALRRLLREPPLWLAVGLSLALLGWPLLSGRTFFFRDLHTWSIPQRAHLAAALRAGHFPTWDPRTHGGQPFAGDVNNLALYPTAALAVVVDPITAVNLEIALHFALAAAAMYALARTVGASPRASLAAATIFALCGISLSLANLLNRLFALPWMAALPLFWMLHVREGRARWFLLAAAAGALQLLAGSPESLLLDFPFAMAWSLAAEAPAGSLSPGVRLRRGAALAALIVVLAAIQVVPMAEILAHSRRARGFSASEAQSWSLDFRRLPELVVPGFFGSVRTLDERDYWGASLEDRGFPYLLSLYVGLVGAALAGAAALGRGDSPRRARRERVFLGLVAIAAVVFALGRFLPFVPGALSRLGLSGALRYPSKFLILLPLPVALLAAMRVDGGAPVRGGSRALAGTLGAAAAFTLLAALGMETSQAFSASMQRFFFDIPFDPRVSAGVAAALVQAGLASGAAAVVLAAGARRPAGAVAGALAAILLADLLAAGIRVNATAPRGVFEGEPPMVGIVRAAVGEGRLYRGPRAAELRLRAPSNDLYWLAAASRARLGYNTATAFGIPLVFDEDFDGLTSLRMSDLTDAVARLPWDRKLPLLSAGAVRVVVVDEPLAADGLAPLESEAARREGCFVYRNERAAGFATLVGFWMYVPEASRALDALRARGFDPRRHAVLEGSGPPPPKASCREPRVRVRSRTETVSEIETDWDCDGFLVFAEPHVEGWHAEIDGRETALRPANVAFSAVFVPSGRHLVRRRYRPTLLGAGAAISVCGAGVAVLASAVRRRTRDRGERPA